MLLNCPLTLLAAACCTAWQLSRVSPQHEDIADEALREIERRLLGERNSYPLTENERAVWVAVATYLDGRIQAAADEKPGREPDMSGAAAAAVRVVLQQLLAFSALDEDGRAEALKKLGHVTVERGDRQRKSARNQELAERFRAKHERMASAGTLVLRSFPECSQDDDPAVLSVLDTKLQSCLVLLLRRVAHFSVSTHGSKLMFALRNELNVWQKSNLTTQHGSTQDHASILMLTPTSISLPPGSAQDRFVNAFPLLGPLLSATLDDSVSTRHVLAMHSTQST